MIPAIYGNSYQILQAPGYLAIRYEMVHETRMILLDGRPHVARWEGDTLVVETTNFKETAYRNANPPPCA